MTNVSPGKLRGVLFLASGMSSLSIDFHQDIGWTERDTVWHLCFGLKRHVCLVARRHTVLQLLMPCPCAASSLALPLPLCSLAPGPCSNITFPFCLYLTPELSCLPFRSFQFSICVPTCNCCPSHMHRANLFDLTCPDVLAQLLTPVLPLNSTISLLQQQVL